MRGVLGAPALPHLLESGALVHCLRPLPPDAVRNLAQCVRRHAVAGDDAVPRLARCLIKNAVSFVFIPKGIFNFRVGRSVVANPAQCLQTCLARIASSTDRNFMTTSPRWACDLVMLGFLYSCTGTKDHCHSCLGWPPRSL